MDSLFTTTTVLLTQEYTRLYSQSQLLAKLSKVTSSTGIRFSKANATYALSGSWEQVNESFQLLQHWIQTPDDEPSDDGYAITRDDVQTEISLGQEAETNLDLLQQVMYDGGLDVKNIGNDLKSLESSTGNDQRESITCSKKTEKDSNHGKHKKIKRQVKEKTNESIEREKLSPQGKITRRSKKSQKCFEKKLNDSIPSVPHVKNRKLRNPRQSSSINKLRESLNVESKNNVDFHKKQEKSDKENIQNDISVSEAEDEDTKITNLSKSKVLKTPGEKGYWSRRKIQDYNETHTCAKCGVVLKSRKRYMEHMRRIHIKEFVCKVCFRGFGYPTDLNRHKCPGIPDPDNKCKAKGGRPCKEKSKVLVQLPCQECDYVGTSQKHLNGHIKRTHRLTHACDKCDKMFGFLRDLERHKKNVHTRNFFFCDKCSKMYKSKSMFEYHLKTHEEGYIQVKIACDVCGKLFTTKYGLNAHQKIEHLGMKKEYLCQVCGKKFSQRNSYKQHMNAHDGIKPYVCGMCGKGFTYHKSLKEHKYLHDNIRRFPCKLCSKAFRQRTTLQIHMQVHKTVKDHKCFHCGKGFSQKQALDRHERTHSGLKPYTCVLCQRTFGDASTVRRHMKAIHQKTDYNWREDITCNLRRKTDYYVLGGSGQNRTFKSKINDSSKDLNPKDNSQIHLTPSTFSSRDWSTQQIAFVQQLPQTTVTQPNNKLECTYNTSLNDLQSNSDLQSNTSIQATGIYELQTSQLGQHSVTMNNGNSAMHVDFNSMPQSVSLSQYAQMGKEGMDQDSLDLLQQGHSVDNPAANLLSAASLLPISTVEESQRVNNLTQSNTDQQSSSDTALNQTLANLWGIMGYPAYYSSNLAQYQGSQNS